MCAPNGSEGSESERSENEGSVSKGNVSDGSVSEGSLHVCMLPCVWYALQCELQWMQCHPPTLTNRHHPTTQPVNHATYTRT